MRRMAVIALLTLTMATGACTSSTDEPPTPAAPRAGGDVSAGATTEAGGAPAKPTDAELVSASERAFEIAEKACRGCPQQKSCEDALTMALRITSDALQSIASGEGEFALRATQTDALAKRFDGLAELSEECDKRKPS